MKAYEKAKIYPFTPKDACIFAGIARYADTRYGRDAGNGNIEMNQDTVKTEKTASWFCFGNI